MTEAVLIFSSFLTAAITGVFGLSGGLTLLAIMANFFPPAILIPLHGFIVAANNAQRTVIMHKDVQWKFLIPIVIGSSIGAFIAGLIFVALPEKTLLMLLSLGLVVMAWLPKLKMENVKIPFFWTSLSTFCGFITVFIGAGGVLVSSVLQRLNWSRQQFVATSSGIGVAMNAPKVVAVSAVSGFVLLDYAALIIAMLIAGYIGVRTGKYFLTRIPEHIFRLVIKIIITLMAVRLGLVALDIF
jgi:uncharacterized membrane protein YfcA